MCRLFGFRSVIPSQVHRSLLSADNALSVQSNEHPDGWGVAFYVDGAPHLTRSATTALGDQLFNRLSGVVSSETVIAHVRKATQGPLNVLNCHPFQHGRWVFAHNGDIPDFAEHRAGLIKLIDPSLRRFILGDTDSEVIFLMLLTELGREGTAHQDVGLRQLLGAARKTIATIREVCRNSDDRPCLLTFMLTNGRSLLAVHGGKELYYSTHKTRCADRDTCPSLSDECEAPSKTGFVNHFILSSEPLQGENVWLELAEGDMVGVDSHMRMMKTSIHKTQLLVV